MRTDQSVSQSINHQSHATQNTFSCTYAFLPSALRFSFHYRQTKRPLSKVLHHFHGTCILKIKSDTFIIIENNNQQPNPIACIWPFIYLSHSAAAPNYHLSNQIAPRNGCLKLGQEGPSIHHPLGYYSIHLSEPPKRCMFPGVAFAEPCHCLRCPAVPTAPASTTSQPRETGLP